MEEIRFITTPDCRGCAFDIKTASKRKLKQIQEDRKHIPKCKDCPRLAEAVKGAGLDG